MYLLYTITIFFNPSMSSQSLLTRIRKYAIKDEECHHDIHSSRRRFARCVREEAQAVFVFYSVHDPQPEKEELWVQKMRQFDDLIKKQQGSFSSRTFLQIPKKARSWASPSGNLSMPGKLPGPFW